MTGWFDRLVGWLLPAPPDIGPGEDVELLDVRTRAEHARGHVAGATLIPLDELPTRWKELRGARKKRILVYCRTGSRSRMGVRILRERGFDRAENAGGIGGLRRAGLEIERGPADG